jgi:hypothetical protein
MIALSKASRPPARTGTSGSPAKGSAISTDSSARSVADGKDDGNPFVLGFDAIGARWEIETHEPLGASLKRRMFERIEEFEATYSRFRSI